MATYEEKVMTFLETPKDRAVLEEQHFERSAELLQLQSFLKEKGLVEEYKLYIEIAESIASEQQ